MCGSAAGRKTHPKKAVHGAKMPRGDYRPGSRTSATPSTRRQFGSKTSVREGANPFNRHRLRSPCRNAPNPSSTSEATETQVLRHATPLSTHQPERRLSGDTETKIHTFRRHYYLEALKHTYDVFGTPLLASPHTHAHRNSIRYPICHLGH